MTTVAQTMNWYNDFLPKFIDPNEEDVDLTFWMNPEQLEEDNFDISNMILRFKRHFKNCQYICVNRTTKNSCIKFIIYQKGSTDIGLLFEVLQDLMENDCRITKLNTQNETLNFVIQKDKDHKTNITEDTIITLF